MNKINRKPRNEEMYKAILTLRTVDECMRFFDDLCTMTELQAMEQRYEVATLLEQGLIYNDILEKNRRVERHDQPREPFAAVRKRRLCRGF